MQGEENKGSKNKVIKYRHSSDCNTIPRLLKKWKTKSGNLAAECWSRHGRVLPGSSAISLLAEVRPVTQEILMASDVMTSSSLFRRLRGSRLLKKIKWAHLGGFWPVWTLSVHCWHELYLRPACTSPWGRVASKHAVKIHFEGFVLCCLEPVCPYHVNKSGSNYNRTLFSTQSRCHGAERSNWQAFTLCFSAWQTVEVRIQHCVYITRVFLKTHLWMLVALCPSQIWVQWGQCSRQTGGPHRLLHTARDEAGFCQQARAGRLRQRLQEGRIAVFICPQAGKAVYRLFIWGFFFFFCPKNVYCSSVTAENISGKKWNICVIIQPATRGRSKYLLFCCELFILIL